MMRTSQVPARHQAVAMEFAAALDDHCVNILVITETGETVTIACPGSSIFTIKQHIEQLGRDCPEIATWDHPRSNR